VQTRALRDTLAQLGLIVSGVAMAGVLLEMPMA
jgi:hypothetical protein